MVAGVMQQRERASMDGAQCSGLGLRERAVKPSFLSSPLPCCPLILTSWVVETLSVDCKHLCRNSNLPPLVSHDSQRKVPEENPKAPSPVFAHPPWP